MHSVSFPRQLPYTHTFRVETHGRASLTNDLHHGTFSMALLHPAKISSPCDLCELKFGITFFLFGMFFRPERRGYFSPGQTECRPGLENAKKNRPNDNGS